MSRNHYLDIAAEWVEHHGFKHWRIRKCEITEVEHGKKSWVEERDLFLTVHALGQKYAVDSGFLLNENHVEDLAFSLRK
jgi:hypothetical protein